MLNTLGSLSINDFLKHYWQKQPVVLRNALPQFSDLLSPEELAGLSLEEDVESRIIQFDPGLKSWNLVTGPQQESTFAKLPETDWTLLVQSIDIWLPQAQQFLKQFEFIPQWRRDDLMISFATQGGGVGPHIDQYDVFLVQGQGKRRWQVGAPNMAVSETIPHPMLKQVRTFAPTIDEILTSGDILYIPPNTPHNGVALDECMTYSVGFRAPSSHMVQEQVLLDLLQQEEFRSERYTDKDPANDFTSSQLPVSVTDWLTKIKDKLSLDQFLIAFGKLVTQSPLAEEHRQESQYCNNEITKLLKSKTDELHLIEGSRITYYTNTDKILCFINGEFIEFQPNHLKIIEELSNLRKITRKNLQIISQDVELIYKIATLISRGDITF